MLKIEILVLIEDIHLMVFQERLYSWQFAILAPDGKIYLDGQRFHSIAAAEQEGREWVKELSINI